MAGVTRLELATSGVTGRRSNQTELHPLTKKMDPCTATGFSVSSDMARARLGSVGAGRLVGGDGIEPPTSTV